MFCGKINFSQRKATIFAFNSFLRSCCLCLLISEAFLTKSLDEEEAESHLSRGRRILSNLSFNSFFLSQNNKSEALTHITKLVLNVSLPFSLRKLLPCTRLSNANLNFLPGNKFCFFSDSFFRLNEAIFLLFTHTNVEWREKEFWIAFRLRSLNIYSAD